MTTLILVLLFPYITHQRSSRVSYIGMCTVIFIAQNNLLPGSVWKIYSLLILQWYVHFCLAFSYLQNNTYIPVTHMKQIINRCG